MSAIVNRLSGLFSSVRRRHIARHLQQCTTQTFTGLKVTVSNTTHTGQQILESDRYRNYDRKPISSWIVNFQDVTTPRQLVRVMKRAAGIPWYFPTLFTTTGDILEDVDEAFKLVESDRDIHANNVLVLGRHEHHEPLSSCPPLHSSMREISNNKNIKNKRVLIFEHIEVLSSNPALYRSLREIYHMAFRFDMSQTVVLTADGDEPYHPYFDDDIYFNKILSRNDAIEYLYRQVRDDPISWYSSDLALQLDERPDDKQYRDQVLGDIVDQVGTDELELWGFGAMTHLLDAVPHIIARMRETYKERLQQTLKFVNVDQVREMLNSLPLQYSSNHCLAFVLWWNPSIKYLADMEILSWDKETRTLDFRLPTIRHAWSTIHDSSK